MFPIGLQTEGLTQLYGVDGAYRVIKDSGFDGADVNFNSLFTSADIINRKVPDFLKPGTTEKDFFEAVKPYKDAAEKYGIENHQCHSPYPSILLDSDDPDYNAFLMETHRRAVLAAGYLGCGYIVIHPFFRKYQMTPPRDESFERDMELYSSLIPAAKESGVRILVENTFVTDRHGDRFTKRYSVMCNHPLEAVRYVDTLNDIAGSEVFGFCMDTGHALIGSRDIYDFIVTLGPRIKCFHVHDNDGSTDRHFAPYTGIMDWNRFCRALHDIHFTDLVSFETHGIFRDGDPEAMTELLKFIAFCGRMFSRRSSEE